MTVKFTLDGKDPDALYRGMMTDEDREHMAKFFEFREYWRAEFDVDPTTGVGTVRFKKTGAP